jgi:DNA-binding NtrC family response regulator
VTDDRFQAELYALLKRRVIRLPPLRERGANDIPLLVEHFIRDMAHVRQVAGISQEAMTMLKARPWKGNVLELRSTIERAMHHGDSAQLQLQDVTKD